MPKLSRLRRRYRCNRCSMHCNLWSNSKHEGNDPQCPHPEMKTQCNWIITEGGKYS